MAASNLRTVVEVSARGRGPGLLEQAAAASATTAEHEEKAVAGVMSAPAAAWLGAFAAAVLQVGGAAAEDKGEGAAGLIRPMRLLSLAALGSPTRRRLRLDSSDMIGCGECDDATCNVIDFESDCKRSEG